MMAIKNSQRKFSSSDFRFEIGAKYCIIITLRPDAGSQKLTSKVALWAMPPNLA